MTDYIIEKEDGSIITEYVEDGKDQVVLITPKASVFSKTISLPPKFREAVATLQGMVENGKIKDSTVAHEIEAEIEALETETKIKNELMEKLRRLIREREKELETLEGSEK